MDVTHITSELKQLDEPYMRLFATLFQAAKIGLFNRGQNLKNRTKSDISDMPITTLFYNGLQREVRLFKVLTKCRPRHPSSKKSAISASRKLTRLTP